MTTRRVVVIYCENSAISRLDVSCSATIKALKGAVRVALKSVGKEWGVDGSYIHLEDDTILLSTDNKGYDAFENDTDAIVGDLVTENEVLFAIVPAPSARSGLPPKYASVFKPRYPLRDGHPATVSSPKDTVTALQNELAEIRAQLAKDRADRKKDKEERERNAQEKRRAKDQRKRDKAEEQERNIQEQKRAKDQRKRDEAAEEWVYKEKVNELSERVEKLQQTVKELENAMKTQDHKVDQLGGRLEAEKNERRREAQASFIEYTDAMDEFLTLGTTTYLDAIRLRNLDMAQGTLAVSAGLTTDISGGSAIWGDSLKAHASIDDRFNTAQMLLKETDDLKVKQLVASRGR